MEPIPLEYFSNETCMLAWHDLMTVIVYDYIDSDEVLNNTRREQTQEDLNTARSIVNSILSIRELYAAFSKTDYISGKNGVATMLDITPNAIYTRFNYLGLEAKDFRLADNVDTLLRKSHKIKSLAAKISNHIQKTIATVDE